MISSSQQSVSFKIICLNETNEESHQVNYSLLFQLILISMLIIILFDILVMMFYLNNILKRLLR